MNNQKQPKLPATITTIIEVFGRENIEKITKIQIQSDPYEKPEPTTEKEIKQLDLFGGEEDED